MKLIPLDRQQWVSQWLRPLIVITMIMCLNVSLVNLARLFNPSWSGIPFLLGMTLTTFEAMYSRRILTQTIKHYDFFFLLRYHLVEWGILIISLKLLLLASRPGLLLTELTLLWNVPSEVFTFEFLMMLMLGLVAWAMTNQTILNFDNLQDPNESGLAMEELSQNFFIGGVLILFISGLTQLVLLWQLNYNTFREQIFNLQRPHVEGIIFNVLIYFMLGLGLLSQVNLTRLLMRWQRQGIEVAPNVVNQWVKYSFTFLGGLAFIAFLLPTSYTLGFLASAGGIIAFVLSIVVFILQIILFLVSVPIFWLLYQLGLTSGEADFTLPKPVAPIITPTETQSPSFWLDVLQSAGFWLVTVMIVLYLLKTYLNDHPELLQALRNVRWFSLLQALFSQLWQTLRGMWAYGASLRPAGITLPKLNQGHDTTTLKRNWAGRNNAPRDQILGYYRDLLEQLERYSYRRRQDHTPYEYEPQLSQARPTVEAEVHALTEAFVQARYSQADFTPDQAAAAKQYWQRIRSSSESDNLGEPP